MVTKFTLKTSFLLISIHYAKTSINMFIHFFVRKPKRLITLPQTLFYCGLNKKFSFSKSLGWLILAAWFVGIIFKTAFFIRKTLSTVPFSHSNGLISFYIDSLIWTPDIKLGELFRFAQKLILISPSIFAKPFWICVVIFSFLTFAPIFRISHLAGNFPFIHFRVVFQSDKRYLLT